VAAIVGILTGSILYIVSGTVVELLGLDSPPFALTEKPLSATRRVWRKKQRMGRPMTTATSRSKISTGLPIEESMKREYAEWLDKDKNRKVSTLVSETILEEEDDSALGF